MDLHLAVADREDGGGGGGSGGLGLRLPRSPHLIVPLLGRKQSGNQEELERWIGSDLIGLDGLNFSPSSWEARLGLDFGVWAGFWGAGRVKRRTGGARKVAFIASRFPQVSGETSRRRLQTGLGLGRHTKSPIVSSAYEAPFRI